MRGGTMLPNAWEGFRFDLGETADMLRETVRNFAADHIAPRADEIDKTNTFPRELWPKLGELGLLGITVEEEYGGAGPGPRRGRHAHARREEGRSLRPQRLENVDHQRARRGHVDRLCQDRSGRRPARDNRLSHRGGNEGRLHRPNNARA